jgi:hypothetical protein
MSPDTDRIAVPTNGRGPHPIDADTPVTPLAPLRGEPPTPGGPPIGPTDEEFAVAFTPKQVAIGFAIVASILVVIGGRLLRRRSGG